MSKLPLIIFLLILPGRNLLAQASFPELVAKAFGSDQELVNGIQFANHYSMVDGHPYFLDEQFRSGSINVNNQVYEGQRIRYNLFSQMLEVEYRTTEGNLNQFMSVPELIPSFTLENRAFVRMQPSDEQTAYYQVISSGTISCYVGWKKTKKLSRSDSSREYQFSAPISTYWLKLGQQLIPFHNKKSFIAIFPEHMKKDISRMLKQERYSFRQASVFEAEEMIQAAIQIYEREELP